jgi:hypothetical protein
MNQTMLIVVLGLVVALLLVVCGILLVLYFKKPAPSANPALNLTLRSPSAVAKRDSKNDGYISSAREELKKIEDLLTSRLTLELTSHIRGLRQELLERLKQGNEENFLEMYAYSISCAKAGDVRVEIERRCESTMENIFDVFQEKLLPATFNAVPDDAALKTRDLMTERLRAVRPQEVLRGQAALKMSLNPVYFELGELARLQTQLANYLPKLQELRTRGKDWGSFAGFFYGGALSAIHPVLGIPVLFGNWFRSKEKKKSEEAFVNTAMNEFANYLGRWERLEDVCLPAWEKQHGHVKETMKRIFEVGLPRILADLDKAGCCLKGVPDAYGHLLQDIQSDIEAISTN